MNNKILYTNNGSLEKHIKEKKIIPYIIYPTDVYKKNKWYYSFFYDKIFKVLDLTYKNCELESAYIVSDSGGYSLIATDLDYREDYAISRDRRSIYKMNIINHQESFTGAEIVYWFFMNNIDVFNEKYSGFWKFVDRYSLDRVIDRQRYYIRAKLIGGVYTECEVIKDINYAKKSENLYHNQCVVYMGKLKDKDSHRIQDKHKQDYL